MKRKLIVKMCIVAIFSSLTFILTAFTSIPIASGSGYLNFSDVVVLLLATLVDPIVGGLVGLIGASLGDLYGGYIHYIGFTMVIKFIEAICAGYLIKIIKGKYLSILPFIISGTIMALLYVIPDIIFYGFSIAAFDLLFNLIQGLLCGVLAFILYKLLNGKVSFIIN